MRKAVVGVVTGGAVAGAAALFAAAYFARQIVVPASRRVEDLPILRVFRDSNDSLLIELPASPRTTVPGRYSIWLPMAQARLHWKDCGHRRRRRARLRRDGDATG